MLLRELIPLKLSKYKYFKICKPCRFKPFLPPLFYPDQQQGEKGGRRPVTTLRVSSFSGPKHGPTAVHDGPHPTPLFLIEGEKTGSVTVAEGVRDRVKDSLGSKPRHIPGRGGLGLGSHVTFSWLLNDHLTVSFLCQFVVC